MTINEKIRADYGTLTHFCRKQNPKININTFRAVLSGAGKSSRIAKLLIKLGYIKNADELGKRSA